MAIRTLIVDDSAFARKVVREVLSTSLEVEVVGAARDGLEALDLTALLNPDVVVCDIQMPGLDGVGYVRRQIRSGRCRSSSSPRPRRTPKMPSRRLARGQSTSSQSRPRSPTMA
jgi:CheY-like chemotaxis protein